MDERTRFLLDRDPGGCWVAVDGAEVVGFAISQNRDRFWYLATYGVLPRHQGGGVGKRLLDAALAHADGRPGMFCSPSTRERAAATGWRASRSTRRCGWSGRSTGPRFRRCPGCVMGAPPTSSGWTGWTATSAAPATDPTTATYIGQEGYLAVRGMEIPAPYLPSGHFL